MSEPFHPGEYLLDELKERGISQRSFAQQIGRPEQTVSEVIGDFLDTTAELWMNLQTTFDLATARQKAKR